MQAVLPGKPQSTLQAFDTVDWDGRRIIAYISRNALIILGGPRDLRQTITFDESQILSAVAIDRATGKIAVSTSSAVYIYRPYGHEYGANVQWSLLFEHNPLNQEDSIVCLSWGLPDEILIGGSSLTLLSTSEQGPKETWTRQLANPVRHAQFSHDAGLIASTGQHDRLSKIWRRLFFGSDNKRFDAAYLLHPAAVTALWWRGRPDAETHTPSVLYTVCADSKLRVWTDVSPHCVHILELWHEIDLLSCIPNPEPSSPRVPAQRHVFTIDSWDFKTMLEDSIAKSENESEREQHHRENLRELAMREPEICMVLDDSGTMSAWGLERVGHKARHLNDVLNIAYAEDAHWSLDRAEPAEDGFVRLCGFVSPHRDGTLNIIAHHHAGRLDWLDSRIDCLLDPARQSSRIVLTAASTGPSASANRMIPGPKHSDCFLTLTHRGEAHVWECSTRADELAIRQRSQIKAGRPTVDGLFLNHDNTVALLHKSCISIWCVTRPSASKLCEASVKLHDASSLKLQASPSKRAPYVILAAATDTLRMQAWKFVKTQSGAELVPLSSSSSSPPAAKPLNIIQSYHHLGTVMAGSQATGSLDSWELVERPGSSDQTASVALEKKRSISLSGDNEFRYIAPAGHHFVALTREATNAVAIWNLDSERLEYQVAFPDHEPIKWLTWGAANEDVSVLAIVLPHRIHVLCQTRASHRGDRPPWIPLQTIDLKTDTPHEADAAMWHPLTDGECHLAVETVANQIFDYAGGFSLRTTDERGKSKLTAYGLVQVAAQLNMDHAVYHPTLLTELVSIGRVDRALEILAALDNRLKFFTSDEELESDLSLDYYDFTSNRDPPQTNGNVEIGTVHESAGTIQFSESTADSLIASLEKTILPQVSKAEQSRLSHIARSIGSNFVQQTSVDALGLQFLIEFERQRLNSGLAVAPMTWREVVWAQHSTCQEILLDLTTRHLDSKLTWEHARSIGLFTWATDVEALKSRFEIVARSEYARSEERNPVDCSLHYVALRKKTALAGLWRLATWNRERTATMRLLANNFDEPRWKSAALKNAYALLGRHRTHYAAAFFLLAGNLKDCVNILANQLNDLQLAIAIARVYEGTEAAGPVLTELIRSHVLVLAAKTGDVWLAVWAYEMLNQHDMALRALTQPLTDLVVVETLDPVAKSYRMDDPSLFYMYNYLRNKHPKAAWAVSARAEKDLALRAAKTYARMGCLPLSLAVLRDFVFSVHVPGATPAAGLGLSGRLGSFRLDDSLSGTSEKAVPSMLDSFADEASPSVPPADDGKQQQEQSISRKVVAAEPSAASILDDFDF